MTPTPEQDAALLEELAESGLVKSYNDDLRAAAALIRTLAAREARMREIDGVTSTALRRLAYWAQTSGGLAGRDDQLVAAIDVAIEALRVRDTAAIGDAP